MPQITMLRKSAMRSAVLTMSANDPSPSYLVLINLADESLPSLIIAPCRATPRRQLYETHRSGLILAPSATGLSKPDLHVFAKLFEDCLKRGLEAQAFSGPLRVGNGSVERCHPRSSLHRNHGTSL